MRERHNNFTNLRSVKGNLALNRRRFIVGAVASIISSPAIICSPAISNTPFSDGLLRNTAISDVCAGATDPNWANEVLLCGFNGSIVDESSAPHTLTAVGNAAVDTTTVKFGTGSLVCDGSGDRVTAADSTDWDFGSGDFTIRGWFNFRTKSTNQALIGQWNNSGGGTNSAWILWHESNRILLSYGVGGSQIDIVGIDPVSTGTWMFYAATRSGNTFRLFRDGVTKQATTRGSTETLNNSTSKLVLGAIGDSNSFPAYDYNGFMDEVEVTKGFALYTADFTPPVCPFPRS